MSPEAQQRREAALGCGRKRFLGDPCARGHSGWRYIASYDCVDCIAERVKLERQQHPERYSVRRKPADLKPAEKVSKAGGAAAYAVDPASNSSPAVEPVIFEPLSLREARARGDKRYLAEPCSRGHDGWRYVSSQECCECARGRRSAYRQAEGRGFNGDPAQALPARAPGVEPPPARVVRLMLVIGPARTCRAITCEGDHLEALAHLGEGIFCGRKSIDGKSYCEEHAARYFVKAQRRVG